MARERVRATLNILIKMGKVDQTRHPDGSVTYYMK